MFCGYSADHLSERYQGHYVSYVGRYPAHPLVNKDGQEAKDGYQLPINADDSTLYVNLDEKPDWSIGMRLQNCLGCPSKEYGGNANDRIQIDHLKKGVYYLSIVHPPHEHGVDTADYDSIIYVLPTLEPDDAGTAPGGAKAIGELSPTHTSLSVDGYVQEFSGRQDNGAPGSPIAADAIDWFKVHVTSKGLLKATVRTSAIPATDMPELLIQYSPDSSNMNIGRMKPGGEQVQPGDHYVSFGMQNGVSFHLYEYSVKYQLDLSFQETP
jgi:hypothetical protein